MVLGLVCARKGSKRLKNKNKLEINGQSLMARACEALVKSQYVDLTYLVTDYEKPDVPNNCKLRIVSKMDDTSILQDVVHKSVWELESPERVFETVIVLVPTNPYIVAAHVDDAYLQFKKHKHMILRSYSFTSEENGLYIIDRNYLLNDYIYDVYTGAYIVPGHEIHTRADYLKARKDLEE